MSVSDLTNCYNMHRGYRSDENGCGCIILCVVCGYRQMSADVCGDCVESKGKVLCYYGQEPAFGMWSQKRREIFSGGSHGPCHSTVFRRGASSSAIVLAIGSCAPVSAVRSTGGCTSGISELEDVSAVAASMLDDIKLDTVDYIPTYDEARTEPTVLRVSSRICWSMVPEVLPLEWQPVFLPIIRLRYATLLSH